MNNKNELRIYAKNIRKNLNIEALSKKITTRIINLDIFQNSKNIMIYYPLKYEINVLELLKQKNKNFYLPRIYEQDMNACPYKQEDKLEKSTFNTFEPTTEAINPQILDLIIVPALMVDKNNYRLGYGKGFYDRFLEKTKAKTMLPISKNLIIDELPIEKHDKKVDYVIYE